MIRNSGNITDVLTKMPVLIDSIPSIRMAKNEFA